jgi:hypothetical protein
MGSNCRDMLSRIKAVVDQIEENKFTEKKPRQTIMQEFQRAYNRADEICRKAQGSTSLPMEGTHRGGIHKWVHQGVKGTDSNIEFLGDIIQTQF